MGRVAKNLVCQHCGRLFTPKQFETHKQEVLKDKAPRRK